MKKLLTFIAACGVMSAALAAEENSAAAPATMEAVEAVQINLNVVWTLIAGILVFVMQAGFALVEAGLTRAKNTSNIMMKNGHTRSLQSHWLPVASGCHAQHDGE